MLIKRLLTTLCIIATAYIHAAARNELSSLIQVLSKQATASTLIGLCANPRGNHVMLMQQQDANELSVTFVYSEDQHLKQHDHLNRIAQELSTNSFLKKFQQLTEEKCLHEPTASEPIFCIENLIALQIQFSRRAAPLEQSYQIKTFGLACHKGGLTRCDVAMVRYMPYDCFHFKHFDMFNPLITAQGIAEGSHQLEPDLPFHLVINCRNWELPYDPTKKIKFSSWGRISIMPQIDEQTYACSTRVQGEIRYDERPHEEPITNLCTVTKKILQ